MNQAAILPSPKSPLSLQTLSIPIPSPLELLIKVSFTALNAIEAKIAKQATPPPPSYPAILGSSYTGTIAAIGSQVTQYQVGDRVLVSKRFATQGNAYAAYQRYVLVAAGEKMVVRIPERMDESEEIELVALVMNASCVAGLFSGRLRLSKPGDEDEDEEEDQQGSEHEVNKAETKRQKTILIYGGSCSFARLALQYLHCAGYNLITTSSPRHIATMRELSGDRTHVVDHTRPTDHVLASLVAKGPYDVVVDMVSIPQTTYITSRVLAAQGGGNLYTTQPASAFVSEDLAEGVHRVFAPWSEPLYERGNEALMEWVVSLYLPLGMQKGWMGAQDVEMVEGGLRGIDRVLEGLILGGRSSGTRFVVDVRE
jgi:NADPH:quinone reductase-like Zn-dependent oxidoreductase